MRRKERKSAVWSAALHDSKSLMILQIFELTGRLFLNQALRRFATPAESVFENVKFNDKLMFWNDTTGLIARIKSVYAVSQYFLRRMAKRKHNGEIPIVGFQTLS